MDTDDTTTDQCTAVAKSTGERCKQPAIPGGDVCRFHGGSAEQVERKAQERLDRMADTTTATIQEQIEDLEDEYGRAVEAGEKLAIMSEMRRLWKIILDRTGHGPTERREVDADVDAEHSFDATEGVTAEFVTYEPDTDDDGRDGDGDG